MKKLLLSTIILLGAAFSFAQNSIPIGSSSNAYSMLRTSQNQVFVDPVLNTVGFVYRQNVSVFGGGSASNGRLRYSISTDGGLNWNIDLGMLNNTYTRPARYPQSCLYNPTGNTNPTSAYIVWGGATLATNFDGHVNGTCPVVTSGTPTSTENYDFVGTSTLIPGGLTESTSGIFWMVENATTNDTTVIDSINVYKGTFNIGTQNVDWVKHIALYAPHSTSFDGAVHSSRPNMAFSPDGQIGYVVFLGDIGTSDSIYNPIIYKSTNGGTTWGPAQELIVDNIAGVGDSIKQYLFDTGTAIESAGEVGTAFEFDITVDANGNLHIFTTLCAVERRDTTNVVTGAKGYVVYSGYPKNAIDIYTTDGGTTWTSFYVAQINTFRTSVPENPTPLAVDNYNQVSRTTNGNVIFYSWSDTDTLIHMGATTNEAPNTFIAARDMTTGWRTCWKQIIGVTNDDFAITPTMAPYVLVDNIATPNKYTLPIVTQEVPSDALSPTNYHYVGAVAYFCKSDFWDPNWQGSQMDLSWSFTSQCYDYQNNCFVSIEDAPTIQFHLYPNPTTDILNIQISDAEDIRSITVVNNTGQVVRTIHPKMMGNGNLFNLDVSGLAAGMYTIHMSTSKSSYAKKFTVVK